MSSLPATLLFSPGTLVRHGTTSDRLPDTETRRPHSTAEHVDQILPRLRDGTGEGGDHGKRGGEVHSCRPRRRWSS